MNKFIIALILVFPIAINAQPWIQDIATNKKQAVDFKELQTTFYNFHDKANVVKGKKLVNNEWHKVPSWKQFKRWEWYWESRVSRTSGLFDGAKSIDKYYNQDSVNNRKGAGNWHSLGPATSDGGYAGIGRVNCVAFHPSNNNIFWVGSPSGGLWKTEDGGKTWKVLTDNNAVLGVSDIVIPSDYETSKTIYIATGDRDGGSIWTLLGNYSSDNNSIGVLKSTDDGATWQTTGLTYSVSENKQIGRLLIHPNDNNILYAGTSDGISKSVNAGKNWTMVYTGTYVIDMEFKPGDPDEMYASTMDYYEKAKILKSNNTGTNWSTLKEFNVSDYRIELAVTPHDPNYLYVVVANQDGGLSTVTRSINSGSSFAELVSGANTGKAMLGYYSDGSGDNEGQGGYDLCIAVSPTNRNVVLVGGVNTWKTTNGGVSWDICNMWTSSSEYNKSNAPEVHADKHSLVFRSNGDLFEANDGGIYISENNGSSWIDLTNDMVISQMYRIGVSQTNANMVIAGLQDNGTKLFESVNWSDVIGGDGMECIIDYTNENIQYAAYLYGEIFRTTDKWRFNQETITESISNDDGAWVTPYVMDYNNNSALYVGYSDVWKTTNKGDSFNKISSINTSEKIRSMAIAPSNSNVIYAADFGHVWKTENGGTSWSEVTNNLPVATNAITYITIKATDDQTVWLSTSAYNGQCIFESTDGGAIWNDISMGLPELPALCVIQNKQVSAVNQLYAATDRGVYVKHGDVDWVNFSDGLPNVVTTELEIYYNSDPEKSRLRAATYGRGLWESELYGSMPKANFSASLKELVQTEAVSFTDLSENGVHTWQWYFEGGDPQFSNIQNPKVVYDTIGVFDVTLIAENDFGTDTLAKQQLITVSELQKPIPVFSANKTMVYVNEPVHFTDKSEFNPTAWAWSFKGAMPDTSNIGAPVVSYGTEGEYDVELKVSNRIGDSSMIANKYIKVITPVAPVAGFTANTTSIFEGQSVAFTDTSLNIPTNWQWTFEGGSPSSSILQHPTIIFNDVGNYTVSLVAANQAGEDSVGKTAYVEVKPILQAQASFSANQRSGSVPFTVGFTNSSKNANSYEWDFGDGGSSSEHSPTYIYENVGTYTVKLKASNENNSSTETKTDYIEVISAEPVANFTAQPTVGKAPLTVSFTNNSQSASIYLWNFGDGGTSSEKSPVYEYENPGDYTVSLTVRNSLGSNTQTKANYIEVNYPDPVADFSASPQNGIAPLLVDFTDLSSDAEAWSWDFGDNSEIKHDRHPSHIFSKGTFDVSLLVTNPSGSDFIVKESYISVDPNDLPEEFEGKLSVYPNPVNDELNISFENDKEQEVSFQLFDASGRVINKLDKTRLLLIQESVDLSNVESGTYLLRVQTAYHIVVLSILKE